jgi:hypothetical protein
VGASSYGDGWTGGSSRGGGAPPLYISPTAAAAAAASQGAAGSYQQGDDLYYQYGVAGGALQRQEQYFERFDAAGTVSVCAAKTCAKECTQQDAIPHVAQTQPRCCCT